MALIINISGVVQTPTVDYTVSGTTLTFTTAPPSGTNNITVQNFGSAGVINVPADGSVTTSKIVDGSVTAAKMANSGYEFGMRNRIINGAMMIDQRNAGASYSLVTGGYINDRFYTNINPGSGHTGQRVPTVPNGNLTNSLKLTVGTGATATAVQQARLVHSIEGYNIADLGWGTASAQAITLSFWVRSSVTGTYAVGFANDANNYSYVATYTINQADTWEYKTITVVGPTSGTWLTDNNRGIKIAWGLGAGSNYQTTAGTWASGGDYYSVSGAANWIGTSGATFYITGVQLEKGSVATPFEFRPYGQELALCQRYLPAFNSTAAGQDVAWGYMPISTLGWLFMNFTVTARVPPTGIYVPDATKFNITWQGGFGGNILAGNLTFSSAGINAGRIAAVVAGAPTTGCGAHLNANASGAQILFTGCEL